MNGLCVCFLLCIFVVWCVCLCFFVWFVFCVLVLCVTLCGVRECNVYLVSVCGVYDVCEYVILCLRMLYLCFCGVCFLCLFV